MLVGFAIVGAAFWLFDRYEAASAAAREVARIAERRADAERRMEEWGRCLTELRRREDYAEPQVETLRLRSGR